MLLQEYAAKVQAKSLRASVLQKSGQYIPMADTWLGVIEKKAITGGNLTEVHHDSELKISRLYDLS